MSDHTYRSTPAFHVMGSNPPPAPPRPQLHGSDPFSDLQDKRIGELTPEQKDRAYEQWARKQIGQNWPLRDVFEAMFRVIDRLRAALATQQAVQGEPVASLEKLTHWAYGPNVFKDWCAQWFGPDSDDEYLGRAARALLALATPPAPGRVERDSWRKCEFCGCNTNAKARACCQKGRDADRAARSSEGGAA